MFALFNFQSPVASFELFALNQLCYYITSSFVCQHFFEIYFSFSFRFLLKSTKKTSLNFLFCCRSLWQLDYYIKSSFICQHLFSSFLKFFSFRLVLIKASHNYSSSKLITCSGVFHCRFSTALLLYRFYSCLSTTFFAILFICAYNIINEFLFNLLIAI